jgi:bacteriocin-like protein
MDTDKMDTNKPMLNPTDDQRKQAEAGEELPEQELKQVVGGAVDAFMQFNNSNE